MINYSGVFKKYEEVQNGFMAKTGLKGRIEQSKEEIKNPCKRERLPFITGKLVDIINNSDKNVIVYDIGGSSGIDYFRILPHIDKNKVIWKIFELKELVKDYFEFTESVNLPISVYNVDDLFINKDNSVLKILHCAGTLQYLPKPSEFLKKFFGKIDFFLLRDICILEKGESFLTIQKGNDLCWFMNEKEFKESLSEYDLKFETKTKFRETENFPKKDVIINYMNFVFERRDS